MNDTLHSGGGAAHEERGSSVPTGKLSRFFRVGATTGKVAATYFGNKIASFWKTDDEKAASLSRAHSVNADRLAKVMGELKGAVMKVGQLLSIQDGVLPGEFRDALQHFQSQAPPMHFAYVRDIVEHELRGKLDKVFRDFETKPLAAASLGQVHRARLPGGEPVAVKVQYPGIDETIRSDLRNLRTFAKSLGLAGKSYDLTEALDEVEEMLAREVDYIEEARAIERFTTALAGVTDEVVVPRVYHSLTTKRVITMEFIEGRHLDDFLRGLPDAATRNRVGERLARVIWRLEFRHGLLHADPHPGNYLFRDDGRIGLLDFGCVKIFKPGFLGPYRRAIVAILDRDDAAVLDAYVKLGFIAADEVGGEKAREYLDWSYLSCEPLLHEGTWEGDWTGFLARLHDKMRDMAVKLGIFTPREAVYLNRVLLGVMCFWNRLEVKLDWNRLIREVLAEPVEVALA